MIKEEFGGRNLVGCECRVVADNAAKDTNTIKVRVFSFFSVWMSLGKVERKAEMNCVHIRKQKNKGAYRIRAHLGQ